MWMNTGHRGFHQHLIQRSGSLVSLDLTNRCQKIECRFPHPGAWALCIKIYQEAVSPRMCDSFEWPSFAAQWKKI